MAFWVMDQSAHNQCVDRHGERLIRSDEEQARSVRLPSRGVLVISNESQTSQTKPGTINGSLLLEMLVAELGLATHREISLEETPDMGNPGGQIGKAPGDAMAASQVVRTVRVYPGFEDTDGRFLPNLMGRGISAAGHPVDSVRKLTAQTEKLSRGHSENAGDPENDTKVRNLPPRHQYRVVPESGDVEAFPDKFWLLLAEHTLLHNRPRTQGRGRAYDYQSRTAPDRMGVSRDKGS